MLRFSKSERITSLKEIEHLFERGHSSSIQAMPLRAVYQLSTAEADTGVSIRILVSVAKKRLRHAVDRNRAKRQVREAYRLHHQELSKALEAGGQQMRIAFVWLSEEPVPTKGVFSSMDKILHTILQRHCCHNSDSDGAQDIT